MFRILFKIIAIGKEYRYWMILAAFIGFLTVGSSIGLMMTSAYIIAKAALHVHIHELEVAIVGVRFFGISRGVFRYLERLVSHETTFRLLAKFRLWFFKSLEPLVPSQTMDYTSGDLLSRSIEDIEKLEHIFVRVISPPFVLILVLFLMWFLLGIFNVLFSLVFTIVYLTAAIGVPLLTYFLSKKIGKQTVALKSKLNELIIDGVQGLGELLSFGASERWLVEITDLEEKLLRQEKKMKIIEGLHESLIGLLLNIAVFSVSIVAIPYVHGGTLEGFYLAVIVIGIMAAFEAVFPIPQAVQYLEQSSEAGKRLLEITRQKTISKIIAPEGITFANYDLKIENLSFKYQNNFYALKNINIEIPFGSNIGLV